jgi:hypothetical protein
MRIIRRRQYCWPAVGSRSSAFGEHAVHHALHAVGVVLGEIGPALAQDVQDLLAARGAGVLGLHLGVGASGVGPEPVLELSGCHVHDPVELVPEGVVDLS